VILIGAVATSFLELTLFGCSSSDKPGYGSSSSSGSPSTPSEGGAQGDGAAADGDGGPGDATTDPIVNGPCLDDKPAPLDGGAPDCGASATCGAICARVSDHYKLGVAQTAIACLVALPSCSTASDVRSCVDKALGNACTDSTSAAYCTSIVKACDPNAGGFGSNISQQGCLSLANGFSASGRSTFKGCLQGKIEAGTCPAEVVTCADDIRQ
jgi:hypothetical protein